MKKCICEFIVGDRIIHNGFKGTVIAINDKPSLKEIFGEDSIHISVIFDTNKDIPLPNAISRIISTDGKDLYECEV